MSLELRAPIVYVEWVDSSRTDGWQNTSEIRELTQDEHELDCFSVGLLVSESDDRIVISTSANPNKDALSPLAIPKCAITRIKKTTVASVFQPARRRRR